MDSELDAHYRMRKSLLGIRDLDPKGVDARIAEIDAEILRLTTLLPSVRSSAREETSGLTVELARMGRARAA